MTSLDMNMLSYLKVREYLHVIVYVNAQLIIS